MFCGRSVVCLRGVSPGWQGGTAAVWAIGQVGHLSGHRYSGYRCIAAARCICTQGLAVRRLSQVAGNLDTRAHPCGRRAPDVQPDRHRGNARHPDIGASIFSAPAGPVADPNTVVVTDRSLHRVGPDGCRAVDQIIRTTALGLHQVPVQIGAVATAVGTAPLQSLIKVKLPLTQPPILLGSTRR